MSVPFGTITDAYGKLFPVLPECGICLGYISISVKRFTFAWCCLPIVRYSFGMGMVQARQLSDNHLPSSTKHMTSITKQLLSKCQAHLICLTFVWSLIARCLVLLDKGLLSKLFESLAGLRSCGAEWIYRSAPAAADYHLISTHARASGPSVRCEYYSSDNPLQPVCFCKSALLHRTFNLPSPQTTHMPSKDHAFGRQHQTHGNCLVEMVVYGIVPCFILNLDRDTATASHRMFTVATSWHV